MKTYDKKFDVLVIGRSCLDLIAVVNRFPKENQKETLEFRFKEGGGQGGTASCCISKLGGRVAYVGKIGDDPEGRFCLKRLQDFGVDTEFVEVVPGGKTPVAYIFVTKSSGDRTIIYEPCRLPKIALSSAIEALIQQSSVVLLDPETTYLGRELKKGAVPGCTIVYDCERWREGIEEAMDWADYFIPSSDFLQSQELRIDAQAIKEKIPKVKALIKGELIVTAGDNGAYYFVEDRLIQVFPPPVQVTDTIGAGDNFHAAFALALSKGFDLERAVTLSVTVASLSCRDYGGRKGLPDWNEAAEKADQVRIIR